MEKSMSEENPTTGEDLRSLAAQLKRRRSRIAKARRGLAVVQDAYSLVIADLHTAYGESDPPAATA
jgi:hypothetical protein